MAWGLTNAFVDARVRGYGALKARGLVFENRRFLQFTCRAASEAVASRRWRRAPPGATAATEHTPSSPPTRAVSWFRAQVRDAADAMKHDEFRVKDIAGQRR